MKLPAPGDTRRARCGWCQAEIVQTWTLYTRPLTGGYWDQRSHACGIVRSASIRFHARDVSSVQDGGISPDSMLVDGGRRVPVKGGG